VLGFERARVRDATYSEAMMEQWYDLIMSRERSADLDRSQSVLGLCNLRSTSIGCAPAADHTRGGRVALNKLMMNMNVNRELERQKLRA
jgi:hypothetical protein